MNEKELKELFISSLKSGHIEGESDCLPRVDSNYELSIKEEGYFRNFDLVVAVRERLCSGRSSFRVKSSESSTDHLNIVMRSGLYTKFALREKCRVDSIEFYPIEIKSDQDSLDERLTHQVLNALLFFGRFCRGFGRQTLGREGSPQAVQIPTRNFPGIQRQRRLF